MMIMQRAMKPSHLANLALAIMLWICQYMIYYWEVGISIAITIRTPLDGGPGQLEGTDMNYPAHLVYQNILIKQEREVKRSNSCYI